VKVAKTTSVSRNVTKHHPDLAAAAKKATFSKVMDAPVKISTSVKQIPHALNFVATHSARLFVVASRVIICVLIDDLVRLKVMQQGDLQSSFFFLNLCMFIGTSLAVLHATREEIHQVSVRSGRQNVLVSHSGLIVNGLVTDIRRRVVYWSTSEIIFYSY
jgi:hypothetical protein